MSLFIFFVILTIIICVLLTIIVLIQNPKGGGLDASFGGVSNNTFGAKQTTDFLEKGTWYLAGALILVCILSAVSVRGISNGNGASENLKNVPASTTAPVSTPDATDNGQETEGILESLESNGDNSSPETTESE